MSLQLTDKLVVGRDGTNYSETWENIEDAVELSFDIAAINNNILNMSTTGIGIGINPDDQVVRKDFGTLTELP